ncbi:MULTISPECIES: response regulator [Micrococcaceae]|jgi:two-component system KDP operon response regulator KdpE|uniref:Transcriptional regulatory protein KdpE n=1 Tax=Paenarthrobacter aurescens (strain TC1) TaxID=290340 RepID=A1R915_PAEAT|nr:MULTISPECIES: response regulator [Micrococcaceae]ABM06680.1 KDP operon transcriptional regulatory [Paenarthrobacter aurescens TC1]AFR30054.1 KDP operon transcriptional regulatory protein KdpE [Arthrobacter sp. Rue61a]MBP2264872.1 two-component system KDP operon response regulator KdpE [Pseudarthrobacter sp. PvP004]
MTLVLIVEDEARIARAMQVTLQANGYQALTVGTGADALQATAKQPVEIVVLDLGLPDMDGVEIIRRIRGWSSMPIIVLSARHASEDKVEALDAGADDYVTKPFGLDELLARLRVASRRVVTEHEEPTLATTDFMVDLAGKKIVKDGSEVRLTPTEWNILELLVRNKGKLVSQQQILTQVWGQAYAKETQYLRVYIAQLRRKLERDPAEPRHLHTEAGMGYRFDP